MKIQKTICPNCKNIFEERPKLSLLGFPKFLCPQCNNKFIYPLTLGLKIVYFILAIALISSVFDLIIEEEVLVFDIIISVTMILLGTLAIIALVKDFSLKRKRRNLGIDYKIK